MTSEAPEGPSREYLALAYGEFSFLMDRRYCSTTLLDTPRVSEAGQPFATYRGCPVTLVHLDRWLEQTFNVPEAPAFPCVVITPTDQLSAETRGLWGGAGRPLYIGWSVGREPALVNLPSGAWGTFPRCLAPRLAERGVVGCRFPEGGGIAYYLDPEVLIRGMLKRST